jgi:methyl-accepting chemotaxis protein
MRLSLLLLTIIPWLALSFLGITLLAPGTPQHSTLGLVVVCIMTLWLALCGFLLLRTYPLNIARLRRYLDRMANGELPEKVTLLSHDEDLGAIERDLNRVVDTLKTKIEALQEQLAISDAMYKTIRAQSQELVDAERQRVMIESLAAACHHIAQPATALKTSLELIKRTAPPDSRDRVETCLEAMREIAETLEKLRQVSTYRTVPYRTIMVDGQEKAIEHILDIDRRA